MVMVGLNIHKWRKMGGGIGENEHNFYHVHFHDALARPPTSWVPPGILPLISLHSALAGSSFHIHSIWNEALRREFRSR